MPRPRSCEAPRASGLPLRPDNSSALQSNLPFDLPSLIKRRRWPNDVTSGPLLFGFPNEPCRLLHEECVMAPTRSAASSMFSSQRCRNLQSGCADAYRRRDSCITTRNACLSLGPNQGLRIAGDTAPRRNVYKSRDQGRRPPNNPDSWRLQLPAITKSVELSCAVPGTRRLGNATLTSPVFPTNFGETLLGAAFDLHAQPQTEALLLAVSEKTWRDWDKSSFWAELLALLWPGSRLHLLTEKGFFREEPGGGELTPLLVDELRTCHLHDVFDDGTRSFQGMQPSLLGEFARRHAHIPRRPPLRGSEGLRIGFVTPSRASDRRRIHNLDELLQACAAQRGVLSCEEVHLDAPGVLKNLHAVAPLHGMVALHGAHVTYAAFPQRPFALLEIKPFPMAEFFFAKYHQAAFTLDTWTYSYFPGKEMHRPVTEPMSPGSNQLIQVAQHQAAVLPVPEFLEWACNVSQRFRAWAA